MCDPPLDAGGVNAMVACALPAGAVPMLGAAGTVAGVTLFDGADARPVPTEFVAVAVNVYAVPLVRPPTVMGEAAPLALIAPGEDVTVYEVIGEPPFEAGGVNATLACAPPATAVPIAGASGTAAGVTLFDGVDAGPVPMPFVAVTVNV